MKAISKESVTVEGILEAIIFYSEETHFAVARFCCVKEDRMITVVGNIYSTNEGERLRLTGNWRSHPKYGKQFKIEHFEVILPTKKEAIEKYLASGFIVGVKESLAKRIVKAFGEQTFEILDNDPDRMREVSGIGQKKAKQIKDSWKAQRSVHEAMVFLSSHGITGSRAAKIYKKYGGNLVSILKHNPYRLAIDIDGIGFLTADKIAQSVGLPEDHPARLQAAIMHTLGEARNQGHCYLPREELLQVAGRLVGKMECDLEESLEALLKLHKLVAPSEAPDCIYQRSLHLYEKQVSYYLHSLMGAKLRRPLKNVEAYISSAERLMDISFSEGQRNAISQTLTDKVSIITGGPGVGKTTIVRALVYILTKHQKNVALAAPTGRAAKRLSEASEATATTIHRLLHYNPHEHSFEYSQENQLDIDWIIIDEASMVDIPLGYHLLSALPPHIGVTFVGDYDQLPSVGPGNFLADLIHSREISTTRLTHIFRQTEGSSIVETAHQINAGVSPQISNHENSDIFFIATDHPSKGAEIITELVTTRLPQRYGLDSLSDIQVLTPMYRADVGADNLNALLSEALNPRKEDAPLNRFQENDKVMQISNNYEKEVYNGDIGILTTVNRIDRTFTVSFDHRDVVYDFLEQDQLVLSYAISIHKSQGSEYSAVIIPLFTQHYIMLERNLLYTAITRGKKLVILVGSWSAFALAIQKIRAKNRYTRLSDLLSNYESGE